MEIVQTNISILLPLLQDRSRGAEGKYDARMTILIKTSLDRWGGGLSDLTAKFMFVCKSL